MTKELTSRRKLLAEVEETIEKHQSELKKSQSDLKKKVDLLQSLILQQNRALQEISMETLIMQRILNDIVTKQPIKLQSVSYLAEVGSDAIISNDKIDWQHLIDQVLSSNNSTEFINGTIVPDEIVSQKRDENSKN